ncbi:unnamed protein product [Bursaphelenchus okinawaensis]|uniref:Hexosyltransferase n=1 Tax=Bursaphelenchus okinawaensis TaxID=465554 RepID=A0A811JQH1_9BILA|nr:unnamed protein product [Bursaphelenchus okinawaensis]CAG9078409.1 unnamed protein product [Bursaphelenchus okinawaensis]
MNWSSLPEVVHLQRFLIKFRLKIEQLNKKYVLIFLVITFFLYTSLNLYHSYNEYFAKGETVLKFESDLVLDPFQARFENKRQNYKMMRANSKDCQGKDLAIMIMSTATENNARLREAMRKVMFKNQPRVVHKFFIGYEEEFPASMLIDEMNEYKDIVYYDGKGDYRNNYLKWYAMYQWHAKYCSNVKTFVKIDDDTTVHIPRLLEWIDRDFNFVTRQIDDYLICALYLGMAPLRVKENRWYITPDEYPYRIWPNYCVGYFVLASNSTVQKLLKAAEKVHFFPMDDVLLTGAVSAVAKIPILDFPGIRSEPNDRLCTNDGLHYSLMRHNSKFAHLIEEDYKFLDELKCPTKPFEEGHD